MLFKKKDYVFFHEDMYCQIQLLPEENINFCYQELNSLHLFLEKHKDEIGYTEVYSRSNEKYPLYKYKIKKEEIEDILKKRLKKYTRVKTGYSSHIKKIRNTVAYGFSTLTIFIEYDDYETIKEIWLWGYSKSMMDIENFRDALINLGKKWSLILVDWEVEEVFSLKDASRVSQYCSELFVKH